MFFKPIIRVSWSSDKAICWTFASSIFTLILFRSSTDFTLSSFASSEVNWLIQSLICVYIKPSELPIIKNPYLLDIANNEIYGSKSSKGSVILIVVFDVTCVSWRNLFLIYIYNINISFLKINL